MGVVGQAFRCRRCTDRHVAEPAGARQGVRCWADHIHALLWWVLRDGKHARAEVGCRLSGQPGARQPTRLARRYAHARVCACVMMMMMMLGTAYLHAACTAY